MANRKLSLTASRPNPNVDQWVVEYVVEGEPPPTTISGTWDQIVRGMGISVAINHPGETFDLTIQNVDFKAWYPASSDPN